MELALELDNQVVEIPLTFLLDTPTLAKILLEPSLVPELPQLKLLETLVPLLAIVSIILLALVDSVLELLLEEFAPNLLLAHLDSGVMLVPVPLKLLLEELALLITMLNVLEIPSVDLTISASICILLLSEEVANKQMNVLWDLSVPLVELKQQLVLPTPPLLSLATTTLTVPTLFTEEFADAIPSMETQFASVL